MAFPYPLHSQSLGKVEQINRSLKTIIVKHSHELYTYWIKIPGFVLLKLRALPKKLLSISPSRSYMDDWFCFLTSYLSYHLSLIAFFIPLWYNFCNLVWNFIYHHLPHSHLDLFFSLINIGELVLLSLPGHNPIPFLLNGQAPSGSPLLSHLPLSSVVSLTGFIFLMSSTSYHCLKITLLFTFWPQ